MARSATEGVREARRAKRAAEGSWREARREAPPPDSCCCMLDPSLTRSYAHIERHVPGARGAYIITNI